MHDAAGRNIRRGHLLHGFSGHENADVVFLSDTVHQRVEILIVDVLNDALGRGFEHVRFLQAVEIVQKHDLEQPQKHEQQCRKRQKIQKNAAAHTHGLLEAQKASPQRGTPARR